MLFDATALRPSFAPVIPPGPGGRYLIERHGLAAAMMARVVEAGVLREGVRGTVHRLHSDAGRPIGSAFRAFEFEREVATVAQEFSAIRSTVCQP
jgi:hypothetical protein